MTNGEEPSQAIKDLAASFQSVVVRSLVGTTERVAAEYDPKTLIVAGGVACNGALREASQAAATRLGIPAYFPSPSSLDRQRGDDRGGGNRETQAGERAGFDLNADVTLRAAKCGQQKKTR